MLTQLNLKTFKCFELLKLPLTPLTLLSGPNASGKSSVLQSLVLLNQTMRENEWSTRIMLNGKLVKLGTVTDVVDQVNGRDRFEIGLENEDTSCQWEFIGDRRDMSPRVSSVRFRGEKNDAPDNLWHMLPDGQENEEAKTFTEPIIQLTYISAEREGPREVYPLQDTHTHTTVGPEGENSVSVLYSGRYESVVDELILEGMPPTLIRQVQARLNRFFPGCEIDVQQVPNTNSLTLGIRTSDDTGYLRPIHSGFGITQILPIIVASLSIPQGNIILIENPEVHLHPAGQALMGQFLAEVSHAGVQVIVETHSDHVLNGIRRSVKAGTIPSEEVMIHFFRPRSPDSTQDTPQVLSPTLDSSGNIDTWPEGFFDQFDRDMDYFAGWGE